MATRSAIPAATLAAYLAADYQVLADDPFTLTIDRPSPELARRLAEHHCAGAAFLTAWNPLGEPAAAANNHAAQEALRAEIAARQLPYFEGAGQDPAGRWPGEPSLLVFGISLESARELAERFRQNAFVYAGRDAVPRLILLR